MPSSKGTSHFKKPSVSPTSARKDAAKSKTTQEEFGAGENENNRGEDTGRVLSSKPLINRLSMVILGETRKMSRSKL
jgi:hypothetical protein